jgi:hypothetical protein
MSNPLTNHMQVMIGPNNRARDFNSLRRYRLRSWTPANTSCTQSMSRLKCKVAVSRLAFEPTYSRGLIRFAARGEKLTPASNEMTERRLSVIPSSYVLKICHFTYELPRDRTSPSAGPNIVMNPPSTEQTVLKLLIAREGILSKKMPTLPFLQCPGLTIILGHNGVVSYTIFVVVRSLFGCNIAGDTVPIQVNDSEQAK